MQITNYDRCLVRNKEAFNRWEVLTHWPDKSNRRKHRSFWQDYSSVTLRAPTNSTGKPGALWLRIWTSPWRFHAFPVKIPQSPRPLRSQKLISHIRTWLLITRGSMRIGQGSSGLHDLTKCFCLFLWRSCRIIVTYRSSPSMSGGRKMQPDILLGVSAGVDSVPSPTWNRKILALYVSVPLSCCPPPLRSDSQ